jgi:hypothetical protein
VLVAAIGGQHAAVPLRRGLRPGAARRVGITAEHLERRRGVIEALRADERLDEVGHPLQDARLDLSSTRSAFA